MLREYFRRGRLHDYIISWDVGSDGKLNYGDSGVTEGEEDSCLSEWCSGGFGGVMDGCESFLV